jgi:hypothetical protein
VVGGVSIMLVVGVTVLVMSIVVGAVAVIVIGL